MNNYMIETFDLTKKYKIKKNKTELLALNKINISIKKGEIFGLLGPNGAGKTTLIQILTTLIQPTSGYAIVNGYNVLKNPKKVKENIALMLDKLILYNRLTVYSNLKFFCEMYGISNYKKKIYHIVKEFGLSKWLNQYVEVLSSGMRMKLALCRTLLLNRNVLFLDEPTLGLDVKSISFIINKLKNVKSTILLTSHDMNFIEKSCDRIAFINKGNIIKIGKKEDIKRIMQAEIKVEIEIVENINNLKSDLVQEDFIREIIENKNGITVSLKSRKDYNNLLSILRKYTVLKIKEQESSLEELFLKVI